MTFPQITRTLHLIDIENCAGKPIPSGDEVEAIRHWYEKHVGVGEADHVVVACNHLAAPEVAFAWPGARLLLRSGPDGADLALLDVVRHERVAERYTRITLASGDGCFAPAVARLIEAHVTVTVVSRPCALSKHLRLAAGGNVVEMHVDPAPEPPAALGHGVAA